jgi:hypothetical protein
MIVMKSAFGEREIGTPSIYEITLPLRPRRFYQEEEKKVWLYPGD